MEILIILVDTFVRNNESLNLHQNFLENLKVELNLFDLNNRDLMNHYEIIPLKYIDQFKLNCSTSIFIQSTFIDLHFPTIEFILSIETTDYFHCKFLDNSNRVKSIFYI
jgi:hypothetical protein